MIVKVVTLGCKVNQCESASIVATLVAHGYNASEGLEPADVYVLNTCSVTAEADKKSRQHLAKMRKINPNCIIIAVGCSTQNDRDKFKQKNVYAIFGTDNKSKNVLNALNSIFKNNNYNTLTDIILNENYGHYNELGGYCYETYPKNNRTRAFVKIQDGCDRFCSYCIIPYLRGRSRSRSIEDILNECKQIQSNEIVLTGVDMSVYGKDIGCSLAMLLKELSSVKARKRIGSLECEAINDEMLDAMANGGYCPHFHLSLQSGSDEVLKTMNRKYTVAFYSEKIKSIRERFPSAGITTDVIVGFPSETDELFDDSIAFIENCGFSDIHVFPYSSRKGTLASRKYTPLDPAMIKSRTERMIALKNKLHGEFLVNNIGATQSVYVEDIENGYNVGYTENYIKVYSNAPCGEIVDLKLIKPYGTGLLGEKV